VEGERGMTELEFTLAVLRHVPSVTVCPDGQEELATRDPKQITAWHTLA
jgi:hypothetical protein